MALQSSASQQRLQNALSCRAALSGKDSAVFEEHVSTKMLYPVVDRHPPTLGNTMKLVC